jgi:pimeloyl-ACP methyl ester carboxylesterase
VPSTDDRAITSYAQAPARTVRVGGDTVAYRELGPRGGVPVVLFVHLAATLDNWDPRVVDALAARRHVIAFDQLGVGASSGRVPATLEEAAEDAYRFLTALGHDRVGVLALSMGGMIAQDLVVAHPHLVRRLLLAGTGPRGGAGIDKVVGTTYRDMARAALTRSDPKELLFFPRDVEGRQAGTEFVQRLTERTADRDASISVRAFRRQLAAIVAFGRSAPSDLSVVTHPTLIVNGDHDRMVPTVLSHDLHQRIAGSELIIYPRSGHGSIFQRWQEFAPTAVRFFGD